MHHLYLLLAIPVTIGIVGWLVSRYYFNGAFHWKEMFVQIGIGAILASTVFFAARCSRMSDTEIWNGTVTDKWHAKTGCCHSYKCNCVDVDDVEVCSTCYRHNHDLAWYARSSNGEMVYSNTCNRPGTSTPRRWKQVRIGEPTAVEHEYTNYIKGNPDAVMKRAGLAKKFGGLLPDYPRVYDLYRVRRFLVMGVPIPRGEAARLNRKLSEINARLGAAKQVNLIVVVAKTADKGYLDALEEYWLGGKKNDAVLVIGAPNYPKIEWAGVVTWSTANNYQENLSGKVMGLGTFDGDKVLAILSDVTRKSFVRKEMADFAYLKATIRPTKGWLWFLYIFGTLLALALQTYFCLADPFGEESYY